MTYEGSTSFVAAEGAVSSCKMSARIIGRYDAHRRKLQSEFPEGRKLDIVICIQFLTYCCNIVQEVALTSTYNRVKNIVIFVLLRCYVA